MASPDRKAKEQKRIEGIGFRLAGIGGEFASNVVAGLLIGWGIDWYFECRPWGIVGGAAAGLAVGTLQFIRQAVALNRQMGPVTPPPGGFKEVPPEVDGPELEGPLPEEEADRADAQAFSPDLSQFLSPDLSQDRGRGPVSDAGDRGECPIDEQGSGGNTPTQLKPDRHGGDPPRTLPVQGVMLAIGGAMLLYVVVVFLLDRQCGQALSWDPNTLNGAVAGGVTSAVSVLASFFAIQPWKSRPAGDWMLYWLGSTTARFLITPPALFSVYSATLLPAAAVFLGGATMFIVALLLETAVIARAVLQAASSSSGSGTS